MNIVKLVILSLRNLLRNSRRTMITVLVSAAGFAALAIFAGYMDFSFFGLRELTVSKGFGAGGGTGHLQIYNTEALEKEERYPLEYGIEGDKALIDSIESVNTVSFSMPRIDFNGLVSNGDKSISFLGLGVSPQEEYQLIEYWNSVRKSGDKRAISGEVYKKLEEAGAAGVLLGNEMAEALNAEVGTDLMLMSTTVDGAVNVVDVTVAGVLNGSMKTLSRHYLVTSLETAQRLMQTEKVSRIVIVLQQTEDTGSTATVFQSKFDNKTDGVLFSVIPWQKLADYYQSVKDLYDIIFGFVGFVVVAIVFLSSANTMLMATMERVREIGTFKAIGVSNGWITLMFLFEGFFIGVLSIAAGLVMQYVFSHIINNLDFRMPPPPGMSSSYRLEIYPAFEFMPWISLLILVSTTFSGLITLFKIRKLSIVNSLSHV